MNKTKQTLIKKYGGLAAYREHMRAIRKKVKNHPGGSFRDVEFARLMGKKRQEKRKHGQSDKI